MPCNKRCGVRALQRKHVQQRKVSSSSRQPLCTHVQNCVQPSAVTVSGQARLGRHLRRTPRNGKHEGSRAAIKRTLGKQRGTTPDRQNQYSSVSRQQQDTLLGYPRERLQAVSLDQGEVDYSVQPTSNKYTNVQALFNRGKQCLSSTVANCCIRLATSRSSAYELSSSTECRL